MPTPEQRPPLLTKPAGVFVQLLAIPTLLFGLALLFASVADVAYLPAGVVVTAAAFGLFWLGRQTRPRPPKG